MTTEEEISKVFEACCNIFFCSYLICLKVEAIKVGKIQKTLELEFYFDFFSNGYIDNHIGNNLLSKLCLRHLYVPHVT
jgi:hypothetical protein